MARRGCLIMDSDLHMMEPDDLWARYLDEPYRANAPRFFGAQQQMLWHSSEDRRNADLIEGMGRCKGSRSRRMGSHPAPLRRGASCGAAAVRAIRISMSRGRAVSTRSRR